MPNLIVFGINYKGENKLKENIVYFEHTQDTVCYPEADTFFNPSENYPEYPWGKENISESENNVYGMVRNVLYNLGLDRLNFGTSDWNPLGDIISKNDIVLIKPNMVTNIHPLGGNLNSVVTHPSVVRVVADYVYIALNGTGKLIIGDSPLQGSDFVDLIKKLGYIELISFLRKNNFIVDLIDFRKTVVDSPDSLHLDGIFTNGDPKGYTSVNLGMHSMFKEVCQKYERFRIPSYESREMHDHHNRLKNEYCIANSIIQADVVINIPKPKTHKRAGITSALKNYVGINGFKEWLPHHTKGSFHDGGDEYPDNNLFKKISLNCREKYGFMHARKQNIVIKKYYYYMYRLFMRLADRTGATQIDEGSWHGNNTIWRTICDLNKVLLYSDKSGKLADTKQRKVLIIGDMIVSGEGNGPLTTDEKYVGVIAGGFNMACFDLAVTTIMGFDFRKIHSVFHSFVKSKYCITDIRPEDVVISSNRDEWDNKSYLGIKRKFTLRYKPSPGWIGNIEMS
jgi:uncharacterized protein (DUF362 family)